MKLDEAVNRVKVLATALRLSAAELELSHKEPRLVIEAEKDAEALELLAAIGGLDTAELLARRVRPYFSRTYGRTP